MDKNSKSLLVGIGVIVLIVVIVEIVLYMVIGKNLYRSYNEFILKI